MISRRDFRRDGSDLRKRLFGSEAGTHFVPNYADLRAELAFGVGWNRPGLALPDRPCHGNSRRAERGQGQIRFHAATAFCHRAAASARKALSVDRETRCRRRLNVLWTAAWMLRKRWADRADLNLCILRSRRRTTWWEFSARLFARSPCS